MRRTILATAISILQGCALTPNQVRQSGVVDHYDRPSKPAQVADCVERRLRNLNGNFTTWRDVTRWGGVDVGAQMTDYGTVALLEITANESGSRVFVYVHRDVFKGKEKQVANEMMAGC